MSMCPFFSIILPIYNALPTLEHCVDGILTQTFKNFELIIINDGSTDASEKICNNYAKADTRVRVINKSNGGVSSARNEGLKISRGEWITFVDCDDEVTPNWLETFLTCIQKGGDMVGQGFQTSTPLYFTPDFAFSPYYYGITYYGTIQEGLSLLSQQYLVGYVWSRAFKRSIIEYFGCEFNESIHFKEDELFVLEYLTHCNTMNLISMPCYKYTVPCWSEKYSTESLDLSVKLWQCVSKIYGNHKNEVLNAYSQRLLKSLMNGNGSLCRDNILMLRALFSNYVFELPCPRVLQIVWSCDITGYISTFLFKLYRSSKIVLRKR